jgi:hypothetical protein
MKLRNYKVEIRRTSCLGLSTWRGGGGRDKSFKTDIRLSNREKVELKYFVERKFVGRYSGMT